MRVFFEFLGTYLGTDKLKNTFVVTYRVSDMSDTLHKATFFIKNCEILDFKKAI